MKEAVNNLKKAFEYYRQAGEPERALRIAQQPVRPRLGTQIGLIDLIEPALEMATVDSPDAARLFAAYGSLLGLAEGRYEEAQSRFEYGIRRLEAVDERYNLITAYTNLVYLVIKNK